MISGSFVIFQPLGSSETVDEKGLATGITRSAFRIGWLLERANSFLIWRSIEFKAMGSPLNNEGVAYPGFSHDSSCLSILSIWKWLCNGTANQYRGFQMISIPHLCGDASRLQCRPSVPDRVLQLHRKWHHKRFLWRMQIVWQLQLFCPRYLKLYWIRCHLSSSINRYPVSWNTSHQSDTVTMKHFQPKDQPSIGFHHFGVRNFRHIFPDGRPIP